MKLKKVKKRPKSQKGGLLVKLLLGYSVSIVLMIALGSISYTQASKVITDNYKNTVTETIRSIARYYELSMNVVSNKVQELRNDSELIAYYTKDDSEEKTSLYKDIKSNLMSMKSNTDGVNAIYVIGSGTAGKNDKTHALKPFSTSGELSDNVYAEFLESAEVESWQSIGSKDGWFGYHTFLDEKSGKTSDKYSIALVRALGKGEGYIVVDMNMDSVVSTLEEINMGEECKAAFVTADGREIRTSASTEEGNMYEQISCFNEVMESEEETGSYTINYKGKSYLFTFAKIGDTGTIVYILIPESFILSQVQGIKTNTMLVVVLASIVAILIGLVLALGINKNIVSIIKNLEKASKGDMTVSFKTKRKDEFAMLTVSLNSMMDSIRKLIVQVSGVGTQVNTTSEEVCESAEVLLKAIGDVTLAVQEINAGNGQQAEDTTDCALLMQQLSEQIEAVSNRSKEMDTIAKDANDIVEEGMLILEDLNDKSKETTKITHVVINGIEELDEKTVKIHDIVDTINEIAEQTNLLSLNASIEAARAGDAGRGFAVVADEIRKLADQSISAAGTIQEIIEDIQNSTSETAGLAKKADKIMQSQEVALENTIQTFNSINEHVTSLTENLSTVSGELFAIDEARQNTLEVIRNIAALSEESAATSQLIEETIEQQNKSVENLAQKAEVLAGDAKNLQKTIGYFTV
ncbi:MAG: methyl-accepting chemotaxis protein [Lachnospiraceae bacterium]|nr:methyl-accepting chemotaxis protein [Lachnospiraceae bacterium]